MPCWTVHLEGGPRRVNHAAVAVGHRVFSFGGYCSGEDYETLRQIDVHVFNAGTEKWWTPAVSGHIPGARDGHSACVLDRTMYVFGGFEQLADCFSNDIHKLDTKLLSWTLVKAKGAPARWRDFHSATVIGSKMFVFGGRADRSGPFHSNNEIYCNRIRAFDLLTETWLDAPQCSAPPEGRRSHSAFAYQGELYVFGGYNARLNRHFQDLWRYTPETGHWQRVEVQGKGPCARRRQCCCIVGDKILLFGGTSPSPDQQDLQDEFYLMDHSDLYILDFSPSLKTLCKLAVLHYSLDQSCLPHDIRWELSAMTTNSTISRPLLSSHG
ncbi:kelch domain-containing protein 3 isoform X2 [Dendropsophus ebraccatus]|uniref:kelch domain-containing protein 3 isoform X2 n=1 Tax=Dendropsophus ebraccatus TaxID=150705 RepID=UPI00383212A7